MWNWWVKKLSRAESLKTLDANIKCWDGGTATRTPGSIFWEAQETAGKRVPERAWEFESPSQRMVLVANRV